MGRNYGSAVMERMDMGEVLSAESAINGDDVVGSKVRLEIFGEEVIEKGVKPSGNSGRVYLPTSWIGHNVKVVRID